MEKIGVTILLFCLFNQVIVAQREKSYQTQEISSPIEIDGNLDEEAWYDVKWEGGFIQTEPDNGDLPTFDTQFKILFDSKNLYVAIRAFDQQPDSISIVNSARDFFDGDYVEINIDSDFDRKDAFSFTITAAGIRGDEHIKTSENWFNDWNPSWTAKTRIDRKGWIAELRIPLSELEIYSKKKRWGIQVNRKLERLNEESSWTKVLDEDNWVEYFGVLEGVENVPISKRFSLTDKIKPESLKRDFTNLHNSLKSSYPSLYRYHSVDYIDKNYSQALKALENEMSLIDFYKATSSYISKIGDGHMKIELPAYFKDLYDEKLRKLPFKFKVTGEIAFISENYSQNDLLNGARIISINGKSFQRIVHEMTDLISSDGYNLTGKYYRISDDFDFYYSLISGFSENVSIDIIPKGQQEVQQINIPLLADREIQKMKSHKKTVRNNKSFGYQVKNKVGILTISTFNHAEGFQEFVDESFKKLAASNIDKLILDFRGNGGGEETNAIHLYSYLTSKPFKYYDRYEVNVDPNKKVNQETTLVSYETLNFFADISSMDKMGRPIIVDFQPLDDLLINPEIWLEPKTENRFDGQIVVLIDGGSFSATSEICAIMARDRRAIFVGTETGGGFDGNTSGIYDQITLPNSRLKVKIPLIKYVSSTKNFKFMFGRGVLPDYALTKDQTIPGNNENDRLLNFGIELLNSKK